MCIIFKGNVRRSKALAMPLMACFMSTTALVAAPAAYAQVLTTATVSGVVTDANGNTVSGVEVVDTSSGNKTYTDERGRYRFSGISVGQTVLEFDSLGVGSASLAVNLSANAQVHDVQLSAPAADTILVIAERVLGLNSERASINKKSILEAGQADKLPDINAAEAIQRLPGVYVDEDRGEGRFVSIRGAASSFNRVKLNGLSLGSPESDGLSVPLDIFSTGTVSTIEVTKAVTPAQDANSVGGEILIRTPTVFGGDTSTSYRIRGGFHSLGGGERVRLGGKTEHIFGGNEQFGLSLSGNYSFRDFIAETVEAGGYNLTDEVPGFAGQPIFAPESVELRLQEVERERINLTGILEYRPNDNVRLYAQGTYSKFSEDEFRERLIIPLEDRFDAFDPNGPIVVAPGVDSGFTADSTGDPLPVLATLTRGTFLEVDRREIDFQRDNTPQEFKIFSVGGEWQGDAWSAKGDIGYSNTAEDRRRESVDFRTDNSVFDVDFDATDDPLRPSFTVVGGADPTDPSIFNFDDFDVFIDTRKDEIWTFSGDVNRPFDIGSTRLDLNIGGRVTLRNRSVTDFGLDYDDPFIDPSNPGLGTSSRALILSDPNLLRENVSDNFLGFYNFGPGVSRRGLESVIAIADAALSDPDPTDPESVLEYVANEDIFAGFVQGTFTAGDLTVLGGVRVERTEFDIASNGGEVEVEITDVNGDEVADESAFAPVVAQQSYTNFFPSLHMRYDFSDDVIFRASAGQTIRRPSFNSQAPDLDISLTQTDQGPGFRTIVVDTGNPDLRPLKSKNFEMGFDTYTKFGVFGITGFYKDISNITIFTVTDNDGADRVAAGDLVSRIEELTSTTGAALNIGPITDNIANGNINGDFRFISVTQSSIADGEILGLELSYSKKFNELPAPFDGFGIDANATLTDSEQEFPVFDGVDLVDIVNLPFVGQSDLSGNVTVSYEKGRFEGRVTYAFVDGFLNGIDGVEDEQNLILDSISERRFARLGAKLGYKLTDRVELSWEGSNLNNRNLNRLGSQPTQLSENERNGWWMEFGVSVKL